MEFKFNSTVFKNTAEITVAPEPAESKLDKVSGILSGKTEAPQELPEAKTEAPQEPVVEVDDFFE